MGNFIKKIGDALTFVKAIRTKRSEPVEEVVEDPLDVELPPPKVGQTAGPVDDTTLRNDLPECLACHRTMVLNGKGVHVSQMNTPVEYLMLFCAKCGKVAIMIAHAKFNRAKPSEKPVLAFTTFWGHPVERRETNTRLRELANNLDKFDKVRALAEEDKINKPIN